MKSHEDIAVAAVALVKPSIEALFQHTKRKELHTIEPWEQPFDDLARNKAQQAWREGTHNLITQKQHPSSLRENDIPFYGSFVYGNVVVACSGLEQWFDMLVSGWIALSFEQLLIHENSCQSN